MPFLILVASALTAGLTSGLIAWRYPRAVRPPAAPSIPAARTIGETVRRHPGLRSVLDRRLDPESATGLALSLALLLITGAGILLGLLASLVRTSASLAQIDNGVAKWGGRHATALSTHCLNGVTQLGSIRVVLVLAVLLGLTELRRTHNRWIVPFIVAVVGGEEIASNVIKQIVDRVRPAFNPAAATLGPSFPSGHTTTAAAFSAAAALLLGRRRPRATRAALTGLAVGIAVAVAASRVLLDVHWLTDVIGGLALGWGWFAVCGIAFGGRVLQFGAAVEIAARVAKPRSLLTRRRASPSGARGAGSSASRRSGAGRGDA